MMKNAFAGTILIGQLLFLSFAGTTAAHAQEEAPAETPSAPDPVDQLCASIGRPATPEELGKLSTYVVTGVTSSYREVLGTFEGMRTRSTRYLGDGSKTAQFVTVAGRKLCLSGPGASEPLCGVPLVCTSGEADYVMVDAGDKPFVRIAKPSAGAQGSSASAEDADWVTFAGGTAGMAAPSGLVGDGGVTPARKAQERQDCAVGGGYPAMDAAWAYYWEGNCSGAYASGPGNAIYVETSGAVRSLALGPGRGLQTAGGQLSWSISDSPLPIAVECRTATDKTIPTSAEEVKSVRVHIGVPYSVSIGNPVVHGALVQRANGYVSRICGNEAVIAPGAIEYTLHSLGTDKKHDLVLRLASSGLVPKDASTSALQNLKTADKSAEQAGRKVFAAFLRDLAEEDRTRKVALALSSERRLNNLANGLRSADVETLVALVNGLGTVMPWKDYPPVFSDGQFRQTWSVSSTDPVKSYLTKDMAESSGWRAILRLVPAGPSDVQLQITCLIPAEEAGGLAVDRWVDVQATLVDYSYGQMVLRCAGP